MANGIKAYMKDKDGNNILAASDWSIVENKPTNLATTGQLPTLGPVLRDGITYENGGYDWDHVNNGYNCCYRIADMGSFKLIELRMMFGCSHDIGGGDQTYSTWLINLPKIIQPDENIESWYPTANDDVYIHLQNSKIGVYTTNNKKYSANNLLSFHTFYLSAM